MVAAAALAIEGPHLSPEGRDRVPSFLRLSRAAAQAFERMRADAFVHRLIERIGLRRQQLFAAQADTLERLMSISKLVDLATAFMPREPQRPTRALLHAPPAPADTARLRALHRGGCRIRAARARARAGVAGCRPDHGVEQR